MILAAGKSVTFNMIVTTMIITVGMDSRFSFNKRVL